MHTANLGRMVDLDRNVADLDIQEINAHLCNGPITLCTMTAASRSQLPTFPSALFPADKLDTGSCDPRSTHSLIASRTRSRFVRKVRALTPPRFMISCTLLESCPAIERQKYDGREDVSRWRLRGVRKFEVASSSSVVVGGE